MGQPKASLDFGGVPLLARIVRELAKRFDEVVIVVAPESEGALPAFAEPITLLRDERAYQGPVDALRRALEAITNDSAFACSCDLPLLNADVAVTLVEMLGNFDAVMPEIGGHLQPLHAVYRKRCVTSLAAMGTRGEPRLTAVVEAINVRRVDEHKLREFDPELRSFVNINTPAEYAHALRLAGFGD